MTDACGHAFAHEALFYAGPQEFLDGTVPFIREGLDADESILVAVPGDRVELLRLALDGQSHRICLADMAKLGRNPGRIIGAWRDFLRENDAERKRVRGIGEPVWAGRRADELVECQRHESLLNLAFDGGPAWRLLCPYDTEALGDEVIAEARRSHPILVEGGLRTDSAAYVPPSPERGPEDDLPEPTGPAERMTFTLDEVSEVRRLVRRRGAEAGLGRDRTGDLVLAVSEVATNSVLHGGGGGVLSIWQDADTLICEVRDRGRIADPLIGRARPTRLQAGGRGMWLVNEVCDLVQVRSLADGNVVRLHLRAA